MFSDCRQPPNCDQWMISGLFGGGGGGSTNYIGERGLRAVKEYANFATLWVGQINKQTYDHSSIRGFGLEIYYLI